MSQGDQLNRDLQESDLGSTWIHEAESGAKSRRDSWVRKIFESSVVAVHEAGHVLEAKPEVALLDRAARNRNGTIVPPPDQAERGRPHPLSHHAQRPLFDGCCEIAITPTTSWDLGRG